MLDLCKRATGDQWEGCPHNSSVIEEHGKCMGDAIAIARLIPNRDFIASCDPQTIEAIIGLLKEARDIILANTSDADWLSKFDEFNKEVAG
jgi:transketolase C-terminal domain/subunit